MARRAAHSSPGFHLPGRAASGWYRPGGDGYHRVAVDRKEKAGTRGAFGLGTRSEVHHAGRSRVLPRCHQESLLSATGTHRRGRQVGPGHRRPEADRSSSDPRRLNREMTETAKPAIPESDWPSLLHDNSRTGGQGVRAAHAPDRARWQVRVGSSIRSAPILRNGFMLVVVTAKSTVWTFPPAKFCGALPPEMALTHRQPWSRTYFLSDVKIFSFTRWMSTAARYVGNMKPDWELPRLRRRQVTLRL